MTTSKSNKTLIVKNTLLLYVRQFFTLILALYTSRLTLQVLGVTDYGIYSAVGGITAILSVLVSSMSTSTQRFLTYAMGVDDGAQLKDVFKSSTQIYVVICAVFLFIAEIAGTWFLYNKMVIPSDRQNVAFWVFQFSIFNCILNFLNVPYNAAIIAHEDMGTTALFSILQSISILLFVIALKYIPYDKLLIYAALQLAVATMIRMTIMLYCRVRYPEVKITHFFSLNRPLIKEMTSVASWVVLSNVAVTGFVQGVNLLFNVFYGPVLNAAYTVAMQAYSGVRSFTSNFQLAANPQIVKHYSAGNLTAMNDLLFMVCKMSLFLILLMSLPFLFYRHEMMILWLEMVPEHATNFFMLLFIYAYIDVMAYPMDVAAQATGQLRNYTLLTACILLMSLPIGYVLLKTGYPPESVYVAVTLLAILGITARIYILSNLILFNKRSFLTSVCMPIMKVALCSIVVSLGMKLFVNNDILSFLHFCTIFVVVAVFIYLFGITSKEKHQCMNMIRSRFKK